MERCDKRDHGRSLAAVLSASVLLVACASTAGPVCPIEDAGFCEFVEELDPLVTSLDTEAILARSDLLCCKGDYASPDEAGLPGFDPDQPCVRSGAYRGEGACSSAEQLQAEFLRRAPLSIVYLLSTSENFADLHVPISDAAVLVSTADPDWYLVIFPVHGEGGWEVSAILGIRRAAMNLFPSGSFISWPLDLSPTRPPPQLPQG